MSEDEYASLVLSPHQQDFTVCYLSQISTEPRKSKRLHHKRKSHKPGSSSNSTEHRKEILDTKLKNGYNKVLFDQEAGLNLIPSHHDSHFGQVQENGNGSPQIDESLSKQIRNELNFSPISMASSMRSPHTSPEGQEAKEQFHRYSTPTNHAPSQEGEIEIGGKKSAFRHYRQQSDRETDGSFLEMIESPRNSKSTDIPVNHQHSQSNTRSQSHSERYESSVQESQPVLEVSHSTAAAQKSAKQQNLSSNTPPQSPSRDSNHSSISSHSEQDSVEETSTRRLYTWVTRHFSCDECPVAWRHPLNMARSMIDKREEYEKTMCMYNQQYFFLYF